MQTFTTVTGIAAPLLLPNINTDAMSPMIAGRSLSADLGRCRLEGPDGRSVTFDVPAERRTALLEGLDEIALMLRMEADIAAFEAEDHRQRPWIYVDR